MVVVPEIVAKRLVKILNIYCTSLASVSDTLWSKRVQNQTVSSGEASVHVVLLLSM